MGKENKDRTLVKRGWLEMKAVEEVIIKEVDILDRIRKLKVVDDEIVKVVVTVMPGPVAVFCMVYHYTKRTTLTM